MTARETLGDRERESGEAAELRRARHMHYDDGREFRFAFNGGVTVTIPLAMVPELGSAATAQLRRLNLSPSGDAIESPGIDRHIAVPDLIREVLGFGEIPLDPEWRVLADHDFEGLYEWVNAERDPRAPDFVEPKPMDGIPPIAVLADNQRRADHAHAHRYARRMRYDHARREFFFFAQ